MHGIKNRHVAGFTSALEILDSESNGGAIVEMYSI
jgi:hypothetical protein